MELQRRSLVALLAPYVLLLLGCAVLFVSGDNEVLVPNLPTSGTVERGGWKCYDIPIQRTLDEDGSYSYDKAYRINIRLQAKSSSSSLMLYASIDSTPNLRKFDYSNTQPGSVKDLMIEGLDFYESIVTACAYGSTAGDFSINAQFILITPLIIHESTTVVIEAGRWAYFRYNLTSIGDSQCLFISLTGASAAMRIRVDENAPSTWRYDYKAMSNVTMYFPEPQVWYIALENTGTMRYSGTLNVNIQDIDVTPIHSNTALNIQMSSGSRYFYYDVDNIEKPKMMTVHVVVAKGDPDVYIRENALPRSGVYDVHDSSWDDIFSLHILVTESTRYYFRVLSYGDSSFAMTVSLDDFSITKATNGSVVSQPPTVDWLYAVIDVPANTGVMWQILVEVNATLGDPDILVKYGNVPSVHDSDSSNWSSDVHTTVSVVNAQAGKWYIGIVPNNEVSYNWQVLILPMAIIHAESGKQYEGKIAKDNNYDNNLAFFSIDAGNAGVNSILSISVVSSLRHDDDDDDDYWNDVDIVAGYNRIPADYYSRDGFAHSYSGNVSLSIPEPNGTWYFVIEFEEGAGYKIIIQLANPKAVGCDATTDSGVTGVYNYYFYDFEDLTYLQVQLDALSSQGNAELYVSHDVLPSRLSYEYNYDGTDHSKALEIAPTKYSRVFIGVYITASTTYTINSCKKVLDIPSLTSGVSVSDEVKEKQWKYYYLDFVSTSSDVLSINVKADKTTPSIYVQEGEFPTRETYASFVQKSSSRVSLFVFNPSVNRYFVGFYGYYASNFSISPVITNKDDLAVPLNPLAPVSASVYGGSWNFYSIYVGNFSAFYLVMDSLTGDPDVYVSYGQMPTSSNFTYRSTSSHDRSIVIMKPVVGFWYIGVLGYMSTNQYSIYARFGDQRAATRIVNGVQVDSSVSPTIWRDYSIEVTYGSMLVVRVSKNNNPVTVYIRYGDLADTATYSRKATVTSSTIYIPNPQYGVYYISVKSTIATTFTLSSFYGGKCVGSSCVCASLDCDSQTVPATSETVYNGLIDEGYWNHYVFNVIDGYYDLSLAFQTNFASRDKINCYVRYGSAPTNTTYDYITGLDPGQRTIQVLDVRPGTLYFSIYGESVVQFGTYSVQGTLTQYPGCPNHCSGHGTCSSAICSCDDKWSGADCSTFSTSLNADEVHELSGHLRPNTYNYFSVVGTTVSNSLNLLLKASLKSSQAGGKIQILANINGAPPSVATSDYSSSQDNSTNPTLIIKKMANQKVVVVALYCSEGPIDYTISTYPTQEESSGGKVFLTIFLVVLVLGLIGGGFYYLRNNQTVINPFGSRTAKPKNRPENNRLFDDNDNNDRDGDDIEATGSSSSNFASALSKASAGDDDDGDLFDSLRADAPSRTPVETTTTTSSESIAPASTTTTTTTTTTSSSATNLLDL